MQPLGRCRHPTDIWAGRKILRNSISETDEGESLFHKETSHLDNLGLTQQRRKHEVRATTSLNKVSCAITRVRRVREGE